MYRFASLVLSLLFVSFAQSAHADRKHAKHAANVCAEFDFNHDGMLSPADRRIFGRRMHIFKECRSHGLLLDGHCSAADLNGDGLVDRSDERMLKPLRRAIQKCTRGKRRVKHAKTPSVLIVGLDSAGWRYLDVLMDFGYLPTMQSLLAEGTRADMSCVDANPWFQCFCPMVWGSIATGVPSAKHRMVNFAIPAEERGASALWEVLEDQQDGTSMVVGWHNTSTSEEALDVLLTDPAVQTAATQVYESYLGGVPLAAEELEETTPLDLLSTLGMLPSRSDRRPLWYPLAEDRVSMEVVLRAALDPVNMGRVDLTMMTLRAPDRVSHILWGWVQHPAGTPFREAAILEYGDTWEGQDFVPDTGFGRPWYELRLGIGFGRGNPVAVYRDIDVWLGKLLYWKQYDYVVFTSDHAMTRNYDPFLSGHHHKDTHIEARLGILSVTGLGVKQGVDVGEVSVLNAAPTLAYILGLKVADDLPGRVLTEMFDDHWLAEHPIESVPSWDD